jgi:hypothetical protein
MIRAVVFQSPAPTATRGATASTTIAAVAIGVTAEAIVRQGAFYRTDAVVVAVVAAGLVVAGLAAGVERRHLTVIVPVVALALWWLAGAARHDSLPSFLPLGASMLGFGAGFVATAGLDAGHRRAAAAVVLGFGAASAAVGLVAEAFRLYPVAARAQDLWRVSTTLTYANAGGLLLAMALLLGLGLDQRNRWVRLGVFLCLAGLAATQSRGAVLACVVALTLVPLSQLRAAGVALVTGVLVGLVAIATSSGDGVRPEVVVAAGLGCGVVVLPGLLSSPRLSRRRQVGLRVALVALSAAALAVGAVLAAEHGHLSRRLTQDRTPEWSAAVEQWLSSPILGVGPDKPLVLDPLTDTTVDFAHQEYLQVLAGTGVVGAALLGAVGAGLVLALRRRDALCCGAVGAVVAFGLAGAFDYVWHLPSLGLVAGWAAGIAAVRTPSPTAPSPNSV